jgi:hypothetical protein
MKVNPNRDLQAAARLSRAAKKVVTVATSDFQASAKLALKLAATPAVRPEAVTRAKALIADPNYPDAKTVRAIAQKLADKIKPANNSEE